ncbi:hypothetical protein Bbelb_313100 [Branchiostoma belcheri]|nr:hypothetical protein Bbelb_313100 [Branchiostoma belcheri]
MKSPSNEDVNKDMENVVELPTIDHDYEDIDNSIEQDEILDEPQTDEQTSAGTPSVPAGNNVADPLGNAMHVPGPLQQTKDGESSNKRMLKSRMVSPALSKMALAQAWLVTTLPDNTTELSQMADTQPDQITSLTGVISTNKTGISTNKADRPVKESSNKRMLRKMAVARPPLVHGDSFGNIHVPRCKNGYRLLAGTCIRLVVSTGFFWLKAGKLYYDAKLACRMEGATLAMPKTEELDVALRGLVKSEGDNKEHWIGMEEKEGTWYWADGSVVDSNGYKGWNPGEPSYYQWPPRCGQYWSGRTGYPMWDDEGCSRVMRWFICQRPPS